VELVLVLEQEQTPKIDVMFVRGVLKPHRYLSKLSVLFVALF
jgi:hypothetical protein